MGFANRLVGLIFVLIGVGIILLGLAQLRIARAVRRFATAAAAELPPRPPRVRPAGWNDPGPLAIRELGVADTPSAAVPQGVSTLFLWVFDRVTTGSLLYRIGRIGPVYSLRGGGTLLGSITDVARMTVGKIDRFIEQSEEEVLARLATFRVRRWFGYYAQFSMLCTDEIWTFALDRMLERCRVVVVDLTDFTAGRAGIAYEIGLLLDRVPLAQTVFVGGPDTDLVAFRALVGAVWDTLAVDSPNRNGPAELRIALTTSLPELATSKKGYGETTISELELVARLVGQASANSPAKPLPPPRVRLLPPPRPR